MNDPRGMVFRNEHETNGEKWYSYNFSVSSKNKDGEWESASMPIRFKRDIEPPEHKTRITLTDWWLKPIKFKDGFVVGIFCKEYEAVDGQIGGFTAIVDDDIPF